MKGLQLFKAETIFSHFVLLESNRPPTEVKRYTLTLSSYILVTWCLLELIALPPRQEI